MHKYQVISEKLQPADLNLPPKFREFRKSQLEALDELAQKTDKFMFLNANCGAGGKTVIMAALPRIRGMLIEKMPTGIRTIYTCHQKTLQEQVISDFSRDLTGKEYAVELRGRANYRCLKNRSLSCNECTKERGNKCAKHCARCEFVDCDARNPAGVVMSVDRCPCVRRCEYWTAKDKAANAELAVLNIQYLLSEANTNDQLFSGWPLVVLDECDLTESVLMEHIGISLPVGILQKLSISSPPLANPIGQQETAEWLSEAISRMKSRIEEMRVHEDPGVANIREQKQFERLMDRLLEFQYEEFDHWVVIPPDEKQITPCVVWKPVDIKKLAERYLWRHASRFLLMSGTILSPGRLGADLGLDPNKVTYTSIDYAFPPETRPIYYSPIVEMTSRNLNINGRAAVWGAVLKQADEIITNHPAVKGLVHTASYGLAEYFMQHSVHGVRLITHENAAERERSLNTFVESREPLVMVSPSIIRGFDGSDDRCRFIIVLKLPYPNPCDPQIARRLQEPEGQIWYDYGVIREAIQETSRGNRHERDFCEIYILDGQFGKLFDGYWRIFPKFWREALHREDLIDKKI
jgi:ATP-dependent DNA helicase DinG